MQATSNILVNVISNSTIKKLLVLLIIVAGIAMTTLNIFFARNLEYDPSEHYVVGSPRLNENAVIVILCRNSDLVDISSSITNFEERFNDKYNYPYVFLNNQLFSTEFKQSIRKIINQSTDIQFGYINPQHNNSWSYPTYINQTKASQNRIDAKSKHIQYGGNEQYHFMCRYFSGYFYDHPLLLKYDYYWRIEPNVKFMCNINYDPFVLMKQRKYVYGYVIVHQEIMATISTLWSTTKSFYSNYTGKSINSLNNPLMQYFLHFKNQEYNGCHYWSNFEIASFHFFRSKEYRAYFKYLDESGGFFYERWGDAPVHTLGLALFAKLSDVYYFDDIAYKHAKMQVCPLKAYFNTSQRCSCLPDIGYQSSLSVCKLLTALHPI